jgi:hypothetical protein
VTIPAYTDPYSDLCFVGPLGSMEALPDVMSSQGTQVDVTRIGGMHRALAGGLTVDTFARKRTWTWTYDMLMDKQIAYIEALQWGHIKGPLRLIDPRRYNRLPEEIATAGTTTGTANAFLTDSSSTAYWHPTRNMPGDLSTLGPRRVLHGGMEWQILVPDPNENLLAARDWRYDGFWRVPLLPNETVEASCWCLYEPTAQIVLGLTWRDGNGLPVTDSTVTELTPGGGDEWIRLAASGTAPDGAVFCTPFLSSQSPYLPTATSIYTTAWQVASPTLARMIPPGVTEHCDVPEIAGEWRQGGGGPFVVPDVSSTTYTKPGFSSSALVLIES